MYSKTVVTIYDFEYLQNNFIAYRDNTPGRLLDGLEKQIEERSLNGIPTGSVRMHIAMIASGGAASLDVAKKMLDAVVLTNRDLPWLEDLRLLAKAEISQRFHDPAQEQEYLETFFQRQPMLFEPDIAFTFYLLEYQEKLKNRVSL